MSQSGARGPALPPKAPAPLAPKVVSPIAPPVVAKPIAPPIRPRLESNAAMSPGGAKVLVAAHVAQPSQVEDDAWDEVATKIESVAHRPPVAPPKIEPTLPKVEAAAPKVEAVAPKAMVPAGDVQALIRAAVDEALAPVGDAFLRLERRVLELERRPATTAAAAPTPFVPSTGVMPVVASPSAVAAPRPVVYAPRTPDIPIDASPVVRHRHPLRRQKPLAVAWRRSSSF